MWLELSTGEAGMNCIRHEDIKKFMEVAGGEGSA